MVDKSKKSGRSSRDEAADREKLGAGLRSAREYLGLSQEEVAKYLGIPRTALSLVESGQRGIDALEIKKLAQLYKRPVASFTGETVSKETLRKEVAHLARAAESLSDVDLKELSRFAEYLRARKNSEGSSDG
jgi:transcriptional regulator with XRE-family HTH domain